MYSNNKIFWLYQNGWAGLFFYFFLFLDQMRVVFECGPRYLHHCNYNNRLGSISFCRFFPIFRENKGSFRGVPRYLGGWQFFSSYLCPGYCILTIKYFGYIKNGWARIFFLFFSLFRASKGSFGDDPRYCRVAKFFVASLCPGNCILTIKYFGYIKNGWFRIFFSIFFYFSGK